MRNVQGGRGALRRGNIHLAVAEHRRGGTDRRERTTGWVGSPQAEPEGQGKDSSRSDRLARGKVLRRAWLVLTDVIQTRYFWILAVACVLTAVLAFGIPRIEFKTGQDTLVSSSSQVYKDNLSYQETFGGDPMIVLFEGDVPRLLSAPNVDTLRSLEADLQQREGVGAIVSPFTVVQLVGDQFPLQQELALSALTRREEAAAQQARAEAAARSASLT